MTSVWNSLNQSVLVNCWRYTGLSEKNVTTEFSSISEPLLDADFVEDFEQFIQAARIQNPMAIENFLNPANEDEWT
jgi:hypothetical protein